MRQAPRTLRGAHQRGARHGRGLAASIVAGSGVLLAGAVAPALAQPAPSAIPAAADTDARIVVRTAEVAPGAVWDPIPYGSVRRAQMAKYAKVHYGINTSALTDVRQIVLHYTVSNNYSSVHSLFAANSAAHNPTGGYSKPGTCTHFVIDRDGTTYQLVPLTLMCRHAVGLNHRSIGIEFVEPRSADAVLARRKQVAAGVALVRWLQDRYAIAKTDVIGHGMVNRSRYFRDLARGWRNTHTDWNPRQVAAFRKKL